MHPQVASRFKALENQKEATLQILHHLTDEQWKQRPQPNKWSALEILAHIVTTEKLSIEYLQKKKNAIAQVGDSGILENLKMLLLKLSQRAPGLKYKARRYVQQNTNTYPDKESLLKDWAYWRAQLKNVLEDIPADMWKRKIYKHPFVGYLNVSQAVAFFGEHIIHHTPQLVRCAKLAR